MSAYEMIARGHALIGALALIAFWTAGLARKGSPLHVRSGRVYLIAMVGLLALAVPLCAQRIAAGEPFGWFLAYLLVITGTASWGAWRSIRLKRDFARYTGGAFQAVAALNLASGAAMLGYGLAHGSAIFIGFSVIGQLVGINMLRLRRSGPAHARWWLSQHMNGMTGNAIATHIAFLSIGLPKMFPMLSGPLLTQMAWFGPLAVAVAARYWVGRRYLGAAPARPTAALLQVERT